MAGWTTPSGTLNVDEEGIYIEGEFLADRPAQDTTTEGHTDD